MTSRKPSPRKRPGSEVQAPEKPSTKGRISPEKRQKLSELAKQRHAEGKLGGSEFGKLGGRGNTKEKRRAAQQLAEHLRTEKLMKAMKKTLEDGLDPNQAIGVRLKTLEVATGIEKDEAKLSLQEETASAQKMSREELVDALKKGLSKGQTMAVINGSAELEEAITDAEVVEDD